MSNKKEETLKEWIEYRFPIFSLLDNIKNYKLPKNLNIFWNFGSISIMALLIQIISGIFLAIHYIPHTSMAFDSIEHIMLEVNYGWLLRYAHANGVSLFFIAVYVHMARAMYYGSYKEPRELIWVMGMLIFFFMAIISFTGQLLSWGQMGFWGATVITNLIATIPLIGEWCANIIRGGDHISSLTLNRFFVFHFLLPLILVGMVIIHIIAVRHRGANNPAGIEITNEAEKTSFYPYYVIKDLIGICLFLIIFSYFIFFDPEFFMQTANNIAADPMLTPANITPEWYFLPFFAILKAVPSKPIGIMLLFLSMFIFTMLPWLDKAKIRSANNRPIFRIFYILFILNILLLGFIGQKEISGIYIIIARSAALYYFAYFLIIIPAISYHENSR